MPMLLEKEKLLIKNTTKKQREKIINGAIALGSLDAPHTDEVTMSYYREYIEGITELEEVKRKVILSINKGV